jgi:hypothetical protein
MYRLIYKSRSTEPVTPEMLHEIAGISRRKNLRHEISGVLIASNTHFLQIIGLAEVEPEVIAILKQRYGVEEGGVYFPTTDWIALSLIQELQTYWGRQV